MSVVCASAPAKINLSLNVAALGDDGYHPLQSLVVFAAIGDDLRFESAPKLTLNIDGPFGSNLAGASDNLVWRAARALQETTNTTLGAAISLTKNLPIAAGIGGGSADAAAALRGLNTLWQCGLSPRDLEDIAAGLGADVPVCVQSRPRFMRGRGQILDDISPWPDLYAVLVNPGIAISTKEVFARFDDFGAGNVLNGLAPKPTKDVDAALAQLAMLDNSLTQAACAQSPAIGALLATLARHDPTALVRLCGSGATCMAIVRNAAAATQLKQALRAEFSQYWVVATLLRGTCSFI